MLPAKPYLLWGVTYSLVGLRGGRRATDSEHPLPFYGSPLF